MRRLLLVMLVAFVGNAQGGAITSGFISLAPAGPLVASLSGADFSAMIVDGDPFDSPVPGYGLTPFPAPVLFFSGSPESGTLSGVTYNGVSYPIGPFCCQALMPYSTPGYSIFLTSPQPTITGSGVYPVTYSVQMSFCLNNPTGGPFYCESDTGIAKGAWNATFGNSSFVLLSGGLDLTVITPEPSTGVLVFAGIAVLGYLQRRYAQVARVVLIQIETKRPMLR